MLPPQKNANDKLLKIRIEKLKVYNSKLITNTQSILDFSNYSENSLKKSLWLRSRKQKPSNYDSGHKILL